MSLTWPPLLATGCALCGALLMASAPIGCGAPAKGAPAAQAALIGSASARGRGSSAPSAPSASASAARARPGCQASDSYAVVAESAMATEQALAVLDAGGSAADAAVVADLVSGVTEPASTGLGGGGLAVVWDAAQGRAVVLDFRESAPANLSASELEGRPLPVGRRGALVGVPGELAGLVELHARWGKLPWASLVRRAAAVARAGFPVSHYLARGLRWNESWVLATPAAAAVLAPAGPLLEVGAVARAATLADTLERIAAEGKAAFYEGALGRDVVATARSAGSTLSLDDLRSYRVVEREPLRTSWLGQDVLTAPPPSGGGLLLTETLRMLDPAELRTLGHGTGAYLHLLAETFRGALADRIRFVGDPAFAPRSLDALLAPARLSARRARISPTATSDVPFAGLRDAGTSHVSVLDASGNAVALTSGIGSMFGAKLLTAAGFPLNDTLDDFTELRVEQLFGADARPNAPRPKARPVCTMTPTIVVRGGVPVVVIGASGGARMAASVTQALLGRLLFERPSAEVVADLRIDVPEGGTLWLEPTASTELRTDLERRGEIAQTRPHYGAVELLTLGQDGCGWHLEAVADPRKGGAGKVRPARP